MQGVSQSQEADLGVVWKDFPYEVVVPPSVGERGSSFWKKFDENSYLKELMELTMVALKPGLGFKALYTIIHVSIRTVRMDIVTNKIYLVFFLFWIKERRSISNWNSLIVFSPSAWLSHVQAF